SDTNDADRRIGVVHAASGVAALSLYVTSFAAGVAGGPGLARGLRLAGFAAAAAGGYLGGHLTFGRGIGVDHTLFDEAPSHWTRVTREAELGEGRPVCVTADRYDILLYRRDGSVCAIANRCTHAGAPLDEGAVDAGGEVTCPWHGSRFRLRDGAVTRGPATAPQPAFETRIRDGNVEVRARC
ncbi:MAG TPA: non-heme iron oxygenase ferredoxin subunit, partial [Candidatus Dormibacteraeota bacterium]|nr:non-heme iron oxygenase ferredoxin subunit [Candidatus Dormibacteraeota bacterium]